jgi:hypothetical protein
MGNLNENSTSYVHSYEPNTNDLTMAMDYNNDGEPVIRVSLGGEDVTITGDVTIPGSIEISNDEGNPIPTHTHLYDENENEYTDSNPFTIDGTVTVLQGTDPWTVSGTVTVDSITGAVTIAQPVEVTQGTDPWTVDGTVNVGNEVSINDGGNSITVDGSVSATVSGTVSVDNFPTTQTVDGTVTIQDGGNSITVDGTVGITGDVNVTQGTDPWTVDGTVDIGSMPEISIDSVTIDGDVNVTQGTDPWIVNYPGQVTSYLGEHSSVPIIPIIQVSSYEGLRERDTQSYSAGGGSVTENGDVLVSCSSTPGSYAVYRSRKFLPYRTGQSNIAKIVGKFDTAVAGTQQRMGVANQESGYYIGYNGTDFQFLHTRGGLAETQELTLSNVSSGNQTLTITLDGTAYTVAISNNDSLATIASKISLEFTDNDAWQVDNYDNKVVFLAGSLGNKTGTFSFSSTGNVTGVFVEKVAGSDADDEWLAFDSLPAGFSPQNYNNFMFKYSWLGVRVYVFMPDGWYKIMDHVHTPRTELPVYKPVFKITCVAYNTGGASGVTLHNSGIYGAIEGEQNITSFTNGGATTKTGLAKDLYHHIMSIQNPYVNHNNDKLNLRSIRFMDLSVSSQSTDPVELYIFFNGQLADDATFDWASVSGIDGLKRYAESRVEAEFDVTGDAPIVALTTGLTGSGQQFDLLPYNLILPPGTHMSLVAKSTNSMSKLAIAGTWGDIG